MEEGIEQAAEPPRNPRVIRRFETWDEVREFFADARPTRPDDAGVVFVGTGGRRATLEEILAYVEEHQRRQAEGG